MIYVALVIVVICLVAQFWPVVLVLVCLWAVGFWIEGRLRRQSARRQVRAIEHARQQATTQLGGLRRDAEAAMWEEFRRHQQ